MKKIIFLISLFFVSQSLLAKESVVEVIQVNNRPASELQPVLMPLLESGDQIVANGDNLIVKTLPERVAVLKNLIRQLDSPVNNLEITVVQSSELTAEQLNVGVGGRINLPGQGAQIQAQVGGVYNQYQGHKNLQNTQTIRTIEGTPAHIKAGNAYPVSTYQAYPGYPGYPETSQSIQYYEATTGFAVTPRLSGEQVSLDVSPWSDRLNKHGQIETQGVETSIRAHLGQWVEIGGIDENSQLSGSGIGVYQAGSTQNRLRVLVKVEKVN